MTDEAKKPVHPSQGGGRYIDDGKGNYTKVDPKSGAYHQYPKAPEPKPEAPAKPDTKESK